MPSKKMKKGIFEVAIWAKKYAKKGSPNRKILTDPPINQPTNGHKQT